MQLISGIVTVSQIGWNMTNRSVFWLLLLDMLQNCKNPQYVTYLLSLLVRLKNVVPQYKRIIKDFRRRNLFKFFRCSNMFKFWGLHTQQVLLPIHKPTSGDFWRKKTQDIYVCGSTGKYKEAEFYSLFGEGLRLLIQTLFSLTDLWHGRYVFAGVRICLLTSFWWLSYSATFRPDGVQGSHYYVLVIPQNQL